MKKTIAILLAAMFLTCSLVACSTDAPQSESTTMPTDSNFAEENTSTETSGQPTQNQAPSQATEDQPTETQAATQPTDTQPSTEPSEEMQPTQPVESTAGATEPSSQPTDPTVTEPTEPAATDPVLDEATLALAAEYEDYVSMSNTEKTAFQNSFSNYGAFFDWYNAALDAYNQAHPPIQIPPDGVIDLG